MVKGWVRPVQALASGVTLTVAVTGEADVFVAVKDAILPVPLAARPIDVALFTQLYTVPFTGPVKITAAEFVPLQTTWLVRVLTSGVGLTVMLNVVDVPLQALATGVTVILAVTGDEPLFVAMKDAIFPLPLAARPTEVVLLAQL
jgi:hypothetical protein